MNECALEMCGVEVVSEPVCSRDVQWNLLVNECALERCGVEVVSERVCSREMCSGSC